MSEPITKEKMTHTPGPWSIGNPPYGDRTYVYSNDATGSAIANVKLTYVPRSMAELEANARLIAAAPDLLNVCRMILDDDDTVELLSDESRAALSTAIAKATGVQS